MSASTDSAVNGAAPCRCSRPRCPHARTSTACRNACRGRLRSPKCRTVTILPPPLCSDGHPVMPSPGAAAIPGSARPTTAELGGLLTAITPSANEYRRCIRSAKPWSRPAGSFVRCVQTTDFHALRAVTTSAGVPSSPPCLRSIEDRAFPGCPRLRWGADRARARPRGPVARAPGWKAAHAAAASASSSDEAASGHEVGERTYGDPKPVRKDHVQGGETARDRARRRS